VRLRPNRGFPRCLACDVTPRNRSFESVTARHSVRREMRRAGRRGHVQCGATGAHYMRGGVVEQGQAVSPGSGGASTYLRRGFPDYLPL
jgi:hypothetical protein